MKKVVSVSLGSKTRDHRGIIELNGQKIEMVREGTDGDVDLLKQRYKELDGEVDCFGAGGFLFGFHVGDKFHKLRVAKNITKVIEETPIVDGSGIKDTIERNALKMLHDEFYDLLGDLPKTAIITSAADRYGMAKAVDDEGFDMLIADFVFGLGLPFKLHSLKWLRRWTTLLMPIVCQFPMSWIYPTGENQTRRESKFEKYFEDKTLIAGDYLYTKKYAPENLENKIIFTNTTTDQDMKNLKERGALGIITSTPDVGGRTFGTNVLEAAVTAYADSNKPLTTEEMEKLIDELDLKPQITKLN